MSFNTFVQRVFEREGYKSKMFADHGGLTIWGITERDYPVEVSEMAKLDREAAKEIAAAIYKKNYWDRVQGDAIEQIVGGEFADQVADCAVNCGVGAAARILQQTVNAVGLNQKWHPVRVDSVIGAETLAALGRAVIANPQRYRDLFAKVYRAMRIQHYIDIVKNNPSQAVFVDGWLLRA